MTEKTGKGRARRSKGSGRVFVRGGVWFMRYRYCGREVTRTTRVAVGEGADAFARSRREAEAVLDAETEVFRLGDMERRLSVLKSMMQDTRERLRDAIANIDRNAPLCRLEDMFVSSSRRAVVSAGQMRAYRLYIREVAGFFGEGVRIADIGTSAADEYAASLSRDGALSPNTYNKRLNGLTLVWDAVIGSVGVSANPWRTIPRKRLDTVVRRVLTDDECERLLSVAQGEERTLVAIGLYTGLRLGDAVSLRWEDIRDGAVFVRTGKTGAEVAIPVHPRLAAIFGAAYREDERVTPRLYNEYKGCGPALSRRMGTLFAKCGIGTGDRTGKGRARPVCGFHSLRSTFVTRCTAAGIPQSVVQTLVGHASQRMTQHYTHLANADILRSFAAIR